MYVYVNSQGYVQMIQNGGIAQTLTGLTRYETDTPLPASPNNDYAYHWEKKTWEDPRTPDQINTQLALAARNQRQPLLNESDWTQIPNGPLTTAQQQAWSSYRQALRDITTQTGFPSVITWPVAPDASK